MPQDTADRNLYVDTSTARKITIIDADGVVLRTVPLKIARAAERDGYATPITGRRGRILRAYRWHGSPIALRQYLHSHACANCRDGVPMADDNRTTVRLGRTILHRWMFHQVHPYDPSAREITR